MKVFILTSILLLSLSAVAGEKGNGGYSIICRDDADVISTAELLDIYEGRLRYKRNYAVDLNTADELLGLAQKKVASFGAFAEKLKKEIELINQNLVFIPEGNELEATDDALPPIKKKGCKFEQAANYTNSGEVLISQEIFDHLDNINKAALILHEAIYSIRRKSLGEDTSENTRKLVAHLMANNGDELVIDKWVRDSLYRPSNKRPCGLSGTFRERIESCSYVQQSPRDLYLVTRSKDFKEVWFDKNNKVLWSDRLPETTNFDWAQKACHGSMIETGFLTEYSWRLPSASDYLAMSSALRAILPNMMGFSERFWFWTSSSRGRMAQTFNGDDGSIGSNPFRGSQSGSVRCVAGLE